MAKIAKIFDLLLTPKYVGQPLRVKNSDFSVKDIEKITEATFSEILVYGCRSRTGG